MSSHQDMPDDFYQHVHQVLKTWYTPASEEVLEGLLLAHAVHQRPDRAATDPVSKDIVQLGLEQLEDVNPTAYDIVQQRFLDQLTAQEIAYERDVSVDVIYQRQRRAIMQLAQLVWQEEMVLRATRAARIEARLDAPTYSRLFGMQDEIDQVRAELEKSSEPWFLAFEGMGGIGKTALADALVRDLAYSSYFHDIAWISARRRLFRLTGSVEASEAVVNLTPEEFIDRLVEQLRLNDLKRQVDRRKFLGVKAYLSSEPCLIVVDNLETARDYEALIPHLRQLAGPSKFILTTRYSLRGESGIYIVPLHGLSPEHTLELIRYEAGLQGLADLSEASDADLLKIYEVTGGNPLATKLVIGQLHTFPLPTILKRLEKCQGGPTGDMLDFIFADAWETLDPKSQWVLQAMLVISDAGGRLEQIVSASKLDLDEVMMCMRTLVQYSLVNVSGDLHERRYKLHPLTQSFVAQHIREAFTLGKDSPG